MEQQYPYEDFIRTYDNILPEEAFDLLYRMIDTVLIWDDSWTKRSVDGRKDGQYWLELEASNVNLAKKIQESLFLHLDLM